MTLLTDLSINFRFLPRKSFLRVPNVRSNPTRNSGENSNSVCNLGSSEPPPEMTATLSQPHSSLTEAILHPCKVPKFPSLVFSKIMFIYLTGGGGGQADREEWAPH